MAAAVALASPLGARFERSVLRGIYPGRANEVDRCLNSKGVRRHRRHYYDTATMRTTCAATVPPQPTPCHSTTHHTLLAEHAPHHTQVTPLTCSPSPAPPHLHPLTCTLSPAPPHLRPLTWGRYVTQLTGGAATNDLLFSFNNPSVAEVGLDAML